MASRKALGRGLGAFFPDYKEEGEAEAPPKEKDQAEGEQSSSTYIEPEKRVNIVLDIPVGDIRPNPHQPRKEFKEESLEELAQSIKKHGLIQPITVRYIGDKRFELISGERRLRASKLAGIDEIPSYIREVNDEDIISYALIENIQREDLNPIEIAMGYERLIEECDYTQAEVAEKVGKNRTTITNMLRLLNLPPFIQKALRDDSISMGHARALINIEDPEVQEEIFEKAIENGYSVRQIEEAVRQIGKKKKQKSKDKKKDENRAFYNEISNRLRRKFSTKVNIKPKKDGGEIRIEYYTDEDLDRLLELFESM
ncbi:ParB/RepB/Spo0J family partition protein [Aliifodinibius sp. S!AR15-10]|uniref:ParB/RepB/Spo0J family partition protein n=1 Tax=Aliifodinibius sp. S!AR15-10 TaxID=2950437 RepID=UPI002860FE49|nr:ParB/RepB/Spo0J family partition protein [Aliifodinibius sp. S!AR15-10]MDR8390159.1 ParB/RepB/Spo0J family partition protein [Aliifodinibius sp. S!AR15-10]